MKIKEIYIDGFGPFYDWKSGNLSDSITIFQGPMRQGRLPCLNFYGEFCMDSQAGKADPL